MALQTVHWQYLCRPGLPYQNVSCVLWMLFYTQQKWHTYCILEVSCTTNKNPDSLRQWWWVVNLKMTALPQHFLRFPREFSLQDLGRSLPKNNNKKTRERKRWTSNQTVPAPKQNIGTLGELSWATKHYCDCDKHLLIVKHCRFSLVVLRLLISSFHHSVYHSRWNSD